MDILTGLTLAVPAGVNAYIPLLAVALAERLGWIRLEAPFDLVGSWWIIGLVAALLAVEVVADKVPAVDHVNDLIQTVVRPAAGGLLALSASGTWGHPLLLVAAGVLIAGSVHAVKATTRPAVNVSTAGAGAPVVSAVEDVGAVIVTVLAFVAPLFAIAAIAVVVVAVLLLARRLRRSRVETV